MKRFFPALFALLVLAFPAEAVTVKILASSKIGPIANADGDNDLNNFYDSLSGFSSSLFSGTVTSSDLTGVDLLVILAPDDAFSLPELDAIRAYVEAGHNLLAIGEQEGFSPTENNYINGLLAGVGSSIQLGDSSVGSGLTNTSAGQIVESPWTEGVNVVNYGNTNVLTGVPTGGDIFLTSSLTAAWGAAQSIGDGNVVALGDSNMISNIESTGTNDNGVFFRNVAIVPEPSSGLLLALGSLALLARSRRQ